MVRDGLKGDPVMSYWGRLSVRGLDQAFIDDYELLKTNLKGDLFAFIPISLVGKPFEAAFILDSIARPNNYQMIGYVLEKGRVKIEVKMKGDNDDLFVNPVQSSSWFSDRRVGLIFPVSILLDFEFPPNTSIELYLLYFINGKNLDRSVFHVDRTAKQEVGKITQFLEKWGVTFSVIPNFEVLDQKFAEVSLQFGRMYFLVNFLIWMLLFIELGIQTRNLKRDMDQTLRLLRLRGLNQNDSNMAFWMMMGSLEIGLVLMSWIVFEAMPNVAAPKGTILFVFGFLLVGKATWFFSGGFSPDLLKYIAMVAFLLNLTALLTENSVLGSIQYSGTVLLILSLVILLYFLDRVLVTLSIRLLTMVKRQQTPHLLFQRISVRNMERNDFVQEMRKLWLVFFMIFIVLGVSATRATINETSWGDVTYEIQEASVSDFIDWKLSLSPQYRSRVSGIGFIGVERSIGESLTIGVIDEEFARLTPGAVDVTEGEDGKHTALVGSSELFKTEGLQIGDRFRGTLNDTDVVFQLVGSFDYLVPFHYRNLKMMNGYFPYTSLQRIGMNLTDVPLRYIAIEQATEDLEESVESRFFLSHKVSFDNTAINEISFLIGMYESIYPAILLIFGYVGIFQSLIWLDILEKQNLLKYKLGNRGLKKSEMDDRKPYIIVNLCILLTLNILFILMNAILLSRDQIKFYLSQPLNLLKIFIVVNLEIIGMLILSWIPISFRKTA